jgi:hypothetical protein
MKQYKPEQVWKAEEEYARDQIEKAKKIPMSAIDLRNTQNPTIIKIKERGETPTQYDVYKEMLKDDMQKKGEQMPEEGSKEFYILMMAEKRECDARTPLLHELYKAQETGDEKKIMQTLEKIVEFMEKRYGISRKQMEELHNLPEEEKEKTASDMTLRKHTLDAEEVIHIKAKKKLSKTPNKPKPNLKNILQKIGNRNERKKHIRETRRKAREEKARKEAKEAKKKWKNKR